MNPDILSVSNPGEASVHANANCRFGNKQSIPMLEHGAGANPIFHNKFLYRHKESVIFSHLT